MKTRINSRSIGQLLRQKNYIAWIMYGLSALLVVVLQSAPRFFPPIFYARPLPIVAFVICAAILGGARTGAAVGVWSGILWGIFSFRLFGFDALVLMLFGLVAGLLVEWYLRANFYTSLLLSACGILLHVLIEWVFCFVIFQKENLAETLYRVLLPNALYTFLLSPLMFGLSYLIARIVRRFSNS